jgi:hypothetical protein
LKRPVAKDTAVTFDDVELVNDLDVVGCAAIWKPVRGKLSWQRNTLTPPARRVGVRCRVRNPEYRRRVPGGPLGFVVSR